MVRWLVALTALLLLSACAQFHRPLAPENRARIKEVDVRVVVAQESFMFSAQSPGVSAALGGGLIPALIDASVQQSRQKAMATEVQATVGPLLAYDYRAEAAQALQAVEADGAFPLKVRSAKVLAGMPAKKDHEASIMATSSGPRLHGADAPLRTRTRGSVAFTTRTTALLWQDGNKEPSYRVGRHLPDPRSIQAVVRKSFND